ncbi:hypothetical protein VTN77DRAFT_8722 [Rasamsonia byssochlamydoides]|uniref:uncharacterized protein n=1 Tax=Rasamsonia byssochlamydoides TaxID=89139 RepID=UPI0037427636
MVDNTPKLRQPPITVLPEPSIPQNPIISIEDIVPEEGRAIFEGFDKSRTAELDLDQYRKLLGAATRRLAYHRAMGRIRPKQENNDGEYIC